MKFLNSCHAYASSMVVSVYSTNFMYPSHRKVFSFMNFSTFYFKISPILKSNIENVHQIRKIRPIFMKNSKYFLLDTLSPILRK